MTKNRKPVVFMNGDESARDCAIMVRDIIFGDFPFIDADTGVEARLKSNDRCIEEAAEATIEHGGGIKISTASNHEKIKAKGWKSANIRLRPLVGTVGMFRITFGPGRYKKPVGIARFGSGDFYNEQSCKIKKIAGADGVKRDTAVIVQHLCVEDLYPFAKICAKIAKERGFQLIYSSKWTISEGERLLSEVCKKVWTEAGLTEGKWRGDGDFYGEITDMAAAYIPGNIKVGDGKIPISGFNGGWLGVTGNANGDTFGDILDFQHDGKCMGSEVACRAGFSYQESPGGTAPGRYGSNYKGDKFFIPMDTLNSFTSAVSDANPSDKPYCDKVMSKAWEYLANTDEAERSTREMLEWVAKEART